MQVQKDLSSIKIDFKEIEISCEKHGLSKIEVACFNNIAPEGKCNECIKAIEEERKFKLDKRLREERVVKMLKYSMIPPRFEKTSFSNFVAKTVEQERRKQTCKEYAENFLNLSQNGTSMVLCGNTGTGKTHLACSIASHVIKEHGEAALFTTMIDLARLVKQTYSKRSERSEDEVIEYFVRPSLLIIDEIGVQFGSDAEKVILFEIINKRYEQLKPTILISNLSPEALKDFIGERVLDRMKEGGGRILIFDWDSHRVTKSDQLKIVSNPINIRK